MRYFKGTAHYKMSDLDNPRPPTIILCAKHSLMSQQKMRDDPVQQMVEWTSVRHAITETDHRCKKFYLKGEGGGGGGGGGYLFEAVCSILQFILSQLKNAYFEYPSIKGSIVLKLAPCNSWFLISSSCGKSVSASTFVRL